MDLMGTFIGFVDYNTHAIRVEVEHSQSNTEYGDESVQRSVDHEPLHLFKLESTPVPLVQVLAHTFG